MDRNHKTLLLISSSQMALVYALTGPIINIHFIGIVDTTIYALSNALSIFLAGIVNAGVTMARIKALYKRYFYIVVIVDVLLFIVISFASLESVTLRFLGLAVLNAISTNIWVIVIRDSINNCIHGDSLTSWQGLLKSCELYAGLAGALLAVAFTNLPLEWCIAFQCLANAVMGCIDTYVYRKLGN